jgi:hypothetical protein
MSITRSTDSRAGFCLTRVLCMVGLVVSLACLCRFAFADLPDDPFQRCATKALRGDFAGAPQWKLDVYDRGLSLGVTANRTAWLTAYYGTRPDGKRDRYGRPCTLRHAAARDEQVPRRAFVWTAQSGIRQVLDTGSVDNIRRARKKGADVWIDAWLPSPSHNSWGSTVTPLAVIPNG